MGIQLQVESHLDFMRGSDSLAVIISNMYDTYNGLRSTYLIDMAELQKYIRATDTTETTNSKLPWKNKTTLPKLAQIRENLHANYMAALFPNDNWLIWRGDDEEADSSEKRRAIEAYIKNKLNKSDFRETVSRLVYDWIDYGNAFGQVTFENNAKVDPETQEKIPGYIGPRLLRISPNDIVFNPTAYSFEESPKIVRYVKSLGDLTYETQTYPNLDYSKEVLDKLYLDRDSFAKLDISDQQKSVGTRIDGFSNFHDYYASGQVEILEFSGDVYDQTTKEYHKDRLITVVDRKYILRNLSNPSWLGTGSICKVGWKNRADTLWDMGPLDNLVGIQYRIDHVENLKADVFDLTAHPVLKIVGDVPDQDWEPGKKFYVGSEGDVVPMFPPQENLTANMELQFYQAQMEELAGMPKQAAGFRTPGEKTKFEVQVLDAGANRIFNSKTAKFNYFLEQITNIMFETSRRNMQAPDVIRVMNSDIGLEHFLKVTKEDITASGKLYPVGARHFADDAQFMQDLVGIMNTSVGQDPAVMVHISKKDLARKIARRLGLKFEENIGLEEQTETTTIAMEYEAQITAHANTTTEPQPEDFMSMGMEGEQPPSA